MDNGANSLLAIRKLQLTTSAEIKKIQEREIAANKARAARILSQLQFELAKQVSSVEISQSSKNG